MVRRVQCQPAARQPRFPACSAVHAGHFITNPKKKAIGETMKPMAIVTLEAGDSLDGNQQVKTFGWRSCQLQDFSERLLQSLSGWRRET